MIRYDGGMNKTKKLSEEEKALYIDVAKVLKGSERRLFMARVVKMLGRGGQVYAEAEMNWNRRTVRKGCKELDSGIVNKDNFKARGRKRAEEHLPNLLVDIKEIVDGWSQTDPTFRTTRLYTRITAKEVRQQLIEQKGSNSNSEIQIKDSASHLNRLTC